MNHLQLALPLPAPAAGSTLQKCQKRKCEEEGGSAAVGVSEAHKSKYK